MQNNLVLSCCMVDGNGIQHRLPSAHFVKPKDVIISSPHHSVHLNRSMASSSSSSASLLFPLDARSSNRTHAVAHFTHHRPSPPESGRNLALLWWKRQKKSSSFVVFSKKLQENALQYNKLGDSDLVISEITLGTVSSLYLSQFWFELLHVEIIRDFSSFQPHCIALGLVEYWSLDCLVLVNLVKNSCVYAHCRWLTASRIRKKRLTNCSVTHLSVELML